MPAALQICDRRGESGRELERRTGESLMPSTKKRVLAAVITGARVGDSGGRRPAIRPLFSIGRAEPAHRLLTSRTRPKPPCGARSSFAVRRRASDERLCRPAFADVSRLCWRCCSSGALQLGQCSTFTTRLRSRCACLTRDRNLRRPPCVFPGQVVLRWPDAVSYKPIVLSAFHRVCCCPETDPGHGRAMRALNLHS